MRVLAFSWNFVPYNVSTGMDFYKRIKNMNSEFDVMFVPEGMRNEQLIDTKINADIHFHEMPDVVVETSIIKKLLKWPQFCLKQYKMKKYDLMISCVFTSFNIIPALIIKKFYNKEIPWVVYFSDSVASHPYFKNGQWSIQFYSIHKWLEKQAFKHADKLIFVSEYQMKNAVGSNEQLLEKSVTVHIGFEGEEKTDGYQLGEQDDIRFGYIGKTDNNRELTPFIKAFEQFIEIHPQKTISFEIAGELYAEDIATISQSKYKEQIIYHGVLPFAEAQEIIKRANVLVVVEGMFPELGFNPFFPSKLAEYMAQYKPIFAITMGQGITADFCRASQNVLTENNTESILRAMNSLGKLQIDYSIYSKFHISKTSAEFEKVIVEAKN